MSEHRLSELSGGLARELRRLPSEQMLELCRLLLNREVTVADLCDLQDAERNDEWSMV